VRARPYHYRSYNLAAMIVRPRIHPASFIRLTTAPLPPTQTSASGGTIQSALDFTMTIPAGSEDPTELYPSVGAGAQQIYPANPWFFWNQLLSDSARG
jgi:hypothetical protein